MAPDFCAEKSFIGTWTYDERLWEGSKDNCQSMRVCIAHVWLWPLGEGGLYYY